MMTKIKKRLSSSQIIILGFAGVILIGAFFLMMPFCTNEGHSTSFFDALFTATSAVCVTGLVVQDTATYWSGIGQFLILVMIQIGGMGVATVAATITILSGKTISLKQRSTMQEAISAFKVGGVVRLTGYIIRMTILFELGAALILALFFYSDLGIKGLWYGLFHSVSAFCNAGFDLMGIKHPYSSLTSLVSQPIINITIMALIIIGGIGFMTWDDIRNNKLHFQKYRMQSKVILLTTLLLILLPSLYFFFFELHELPFDQRIWASLFQSVTPRTAGFNTIDLNMLSESGLSLMIILMLIGGAPGSTAGGMKITTFAVLIKTTVSVFKRQKDTVFFNRRITDDAICNSLSVLMTYLVLFLSGAFLISKLERLPLLTCLFETASAIGTVGLTLGITTQLGTVSRLILIILMYVGRVGGLTLIFSTISANQNSASRMPLGKITIG